MSDPHFPPRLSPSVESLSQRWELLCILRKSHLRWMDEANDLNLREIHGVLADLFQGVIDQYEILLGELRSNVRLGEDTEGRNHA